VIEETPYNPLDKRNLGISVADALLERPIHRLPPDEPFIGAGIYAIYYFGKYKPYQPIALRNRDNRYDAPIYVGKAVPAGARKGGFGLEVTTGPVLFNRLREHAESLQQARNLKLTDFACRYLVVDDIWIPLGEAMMISKFTPVWNRIIDGFGNHDPGKGRYQQQRSPWDVLHPGRAWAERCVECKRTEAELLESLQSHFDLLENV
jgi:hypothetical protein